MAALFFRELDIAARRSAFVAAMAAQAGLLAAFVLAWGDGSGVPLWTDRTFYQQVQLVQGSLLVLLLPWAAARCVADERGNDLVLLSMITAINPSRLLLVRTCAVLAGLWLIVLSGLPVVLLAQRMSAIGMAPMVRDECTMLAIAVTACAAAICWRHVCRSRLLGWLAAACSTVGVTATVRLLLPSAAQGSAALVLMGAGASLLLAVRANTSLRYFSEPA